jgi:hypothetical protein
VVSNFAKVGPWLVLATPTPELSTRVTIAHATEIATEVRHRLLPI